MRNRGKKIEEKIKREIERELEREITSKFREVLRKILNKIFKRTFSIATVVLLGTTSIRTYAEGLQQQPLQPSILERQASIYFNGSGSLINILNINGSTYVNIDDLGIFGFESKWDLNKDNPTTGITFNIKSKDFGDEVNGTIYKANEKLIKVLYPTLSTLDKDDDGLISINLEEPIKYYVKDDNLYVCLRDMANAFKCNIDFYVAEKKNSDVVVEREEFILINRSLWKSGNGEFVLK